MGNLSGLPSGAICSFWPTRLSRRQVKAKQQGDIAMKIWEIWLVATQLLLAACATNGGTTPPPPADDGPNDGSVASGGGLGGGTYPMPT